jgi:hypothetical protein
MIAIFRAHQFVVFSGLLSVDVLIVCIHNDGMIAQIQASYQADQGDPRRVSLPPCGDTALILRKMHFRAFF